MDSKPSSTGIVYNWYVYDGNDVILDVAKTDGALASGVTTTRYLWAPHMNAGETSLLLASQTIDWGGSTGPAYWALQDHQNSVRDLVHMNGSNGTRDVHVVFDSFGNLITTIRNGTTYSGSSVLSGLIIRYLYTGQEYDIATGLYYYNNRWYDAGTSTFTTQDPIGFRGRDANLYRYVRNNSLNFTDPSGLSDLPAGQMYNKAGGPPAGTVYNKGKGGGNVSGPRANGEGQNKTCPPQPNNGGYDPAEANREMDRVNANAANADARKAQTIKNNPGVDAQDGVFDYAVDMAVGLSDGADRGATVYLNALTLGKIDSLNQQATAYQQEALNKGWTMETIGYVGANASATATQGLVIIGTAGLATAYVPGVATVGTTISTSIAAVPGASTAISLVATVGLGTAGAYNIEAALISYENGDAAQANSLMGSGIVEVASAANIGLEAARPFNPANWDYSQPTPLGAPSTTFTPQQIQAMNEQINMAQAQNAARNLPSPANNTGNTCPKPATAGNLKFGDPGYGTNVHQKFGSVLQNQTGTQPGDWRMNTAPNLRGVDAEYIGPPATNPGFRFAELKPLSDGGWIQFQKQMNSWQLPPGETQLWFYNESGTIGSTGINY